MAAEQHSCAICLELMEDMGKASFLPCFHCFHQHCFNDYVIHKIKQSSDIMCPVCRVSHFKHGDSNYAFIMNELCICVDDEMPATLPVVHNSFVLDASRNDWQPHIVVNMQQRSTDNGISTKSRISDVLWLRYKYCIITLIVICMLTSTIVIIIRQS